MGFYVKFMIFHNPSSVQIDGQWTSVSLQVQAMTEWGVTELCLSNNSRATLVQQLTHMRFPLLTYLNIWGNQIQSIEGLSTLYMPHIRILHLNDNKITCVGTMRKACWPALKILSISINHFGDAKRLVEGYYPQIQQFYVCNPWLDENQFIEHQFVFKLQASLKDIYINKDKFCFHRSIGVLDQRYPNISIQ